MVSIPPSCLLRNFETGDENNMSEIHGRAFDYTHSPEEYEKWFIQIRQDTLRLHEGDERLIFINAWNEWAEGCHLEPDQRYGRAYLQATQRAMDARLGVRVKGALKEMEAVGD